MQIVTRVLEHIDVIAPTKTTSVGKVAKKLKDTKEEFSSFAEAPFKAEIVVYQTAEDLLE